MGKIQLDTTEQETILDVIKQNAFLLKNFYFTGGTALSSIYLHHRYSEDLDFFSQDRFDNQAIFEIVEEWSKKYQLTFNSRFVEVVYIFNLKFQNGALLKVDFSYYPHRKVETEKIIDGIRVDSLTDIAVNKLLTISQRTEVKDFVDLYFLLKEFSLWDLIAGVKVKFNIEIEPFLLASDFLKVDGFTFLPKMIKPLTLPQLQDFFREEAKKLAKQAVI